VSPTKRILLATVAVLAVFYATDYLVARKQPFGSIRVQPYLAVPQKNGKFEIIMQDPEDDPCVHSLLPHMDRQPCWYLNDHRQKRIEM
jgi:hypothetical protein